MLFDEVENVFVLEADVKLPLQTQVLECRFVGRYWPFGASQPGIEWSTTRKHFAPTERRTFDEIWRL